MRSENAFRVKSYYQTRLFFEKLIQKSNYDKYRSPLIKETMIFVAHNALAFTRIVSLRRSRQTQGPLVNKLLTTNTKRNQKLKIRESISR